MPHSMISHLVGKNNDDILFAKLPFRSSHTVQYKLGTYTIHFHVLTVDSNLCSILHFETPNLKDWMSRTEVTDLEVSGLVGQLN